MRLHTEPDVDWKNIFQLWREAGEILPMRVVKNSWSAVAGHYLIVEHIEIGRWPYGSAWGQYHWHGTSDPTGEKINQPGTYTWRVL